MRKIYVSLFAIIFVCGFSSQIKNYGTSTFNSPITDYHCKQINSLFQQHNINRGGVVIDDFGRIKLVGSYRNNSEVDIAFSLAQTAVGIKWVSPVTPENIDVPEWTRKISKLFPTTDKTGPITYSDSSAPGPIADKYAIVIGLSRFQESKITPLQFAAKDAADFYNFLLSPGGGGFDKDKVFFLINENATKANILEAFNSLEGRVQANDLVLLFFSTHGTPPEKFGDVFLVTYDTIVKPRHSVWSTSITNEMLTEFIKEIKAKRMVVVLDACYSNGAYKQVEGFLPTGGKSLGVEDEEGEGYSKIRLKKLIGAKDIVVDDEYPGTLKKQAQNKRGWGKVLFGASGAGEKSWESENLNNSFFTYYFLEGLKRSDDVKQAFYYAKPKVTENVRREKDADQHPQVIADKKDWDIAIK